MVKTAHRHFPKKFLQDEEIAERAGHFIVVSSKDGVSLRVVAWNDGKKDSKTKKVIRNQIACRQPPVELPYPGEHGTPKAPLAS